MVSLSPTWNQHYVSQTEQGLNAIDPSLVSRRRRIFRLEVVDRDTHRLSTPPSDGSKIRWSLSFRDLFSLDVVDATSRHNLEEVFGRYEADVAADSKRLLDRLRAGNGEGVENEIRSVFSTKLMNFARNPHCIRKALNTFGAVTAHAFTDPYLRGQCEAFVSGSRPQRGNVCATFDITDDEYDRWLLMLYMLFVEHSPDQSLFDTAVDGLFASNRVHIELCEYVGVDAGDVCLLSDRGFNVFDVRVPSGGLASVYEFNICKHAFAAVAFSTGTGGQGAITMRRHQNQRAMLVAFNQRTISHCAHMVFAGNATPMLGERGGTH